MLKEEVLIKAKAMEALQDTIESSVYDTTDDQLNSYISGATIAINNMLSKLEDLDWLKNVEK